MNKSLSFKIKRNGKFNISKTDYEVLSFLYKPLIGSFAHDLYVVFILLTDDKKEFTSSVILLNDIMSDKGKRIGNINEAIITLEKYKLIKISSPTEFIIYPPYGKDEFKESSLYSLYLNMISLNELELSKDLFCWENATIGDLKPINSEETLKKLKPSTRKEKMIDFDFSKFQNHIKNSGLVVKEEDETFFMSLASTFSFSLDEMLVIFYESQDDDYYDRKKIIVNSYKKFEKKESLDALEKTNKMLGDEENIQYILNTRPIDFLRKASKGIVNESDKTVLDRLKNETGLPDDLITTLLLYSIVAHNNRIMSFRFFEKIAQDWEKTGIKNAKDAYYYITDLYNRKNNQKTNKTNKRSAEDQYNDYIKRMLKEEENE